MIAPKPISAPVANYRARLKECLRVLGVLEDASVRPPLQPLDAAERRRLEETLVEVGLLKGVVA